MKHNRVLKIYGIILGLIILLAIILNASQPRTINWAPTFSEKGTTPYALKIFHDRLGDVFSKDSVQDINVTPYEFLDNAYSYKDSLYTKNGSLIFINDYTEIDESSINEILNYVSWGNTVFISSYNLPDKLKDTLHIVIANALQLEGKRLGLVNPAFEKDSLYVSFKPENRYFSKIDTATTTILGYQKGQKIRANFIKVPYKHGYFILHTQPLAFTNYYLLKNDNYKYVTHALSYIPKREIYFNSNIKMVNISNSPLRFILSKPALRWMWYLFLVTLFIFTIFNIKRKQRIIKTIIPLKNTTVAFTKTIGNFYYETKDHDNAIEKKITYFLERIRNEFLLDTQNLNEIFIKNLSLKAAYPKEKTEKLILLIQHLQQKNNCTEEDLQRLNTAIENFYAKK
ncbi:DUF4350 domain-containing protein [Zhouia sp. PK063]|uniref:DUF4350 domain-containing protein n=1 Tax=Zhouia sp. PK063 TaxID=3373602 RepID=UPI0037BBFDAF